MTSDDAQCGGPVDPAQSGRSEDPGALRGPRDTGQAAAERVRARLRGLSRLGVAYSGGVDSAVLLALAVGELGSDSVVALIGVSASLARSELVWARETADALGVTVVEVPTHEQDRPGYAANGPDRCYHCKDELFTRIDLEVIERLGLTAIAYGENADDRVAPDRPGSRAAIEHGVLTPLADAGLGKDEVRAVARLLGLAQADKPATPCLASRIPHDRPVSAERLGQVEQAEAGLHALGFDDCRVRHHGEWARVELPLTDLPRLRQPQVHEQVLAAVSAAGFADVVIDPDGLQSGAFTRRALAETQG